MLVVVKRPYTDLSFDIYPVSAETEVLTSGHNVVLVGTDANDTV